MPLVVGVDSSSSACKVQVRDAESGRLISTGLASHSATTPPRSEQDPGEWWSAFEAASEQASVLKHGPAGLSFAAQQHGLVVLGPDRQPLRPAKLWNDTESAQDSADLIAALPGGASEWASICGSVPVPSFTITKLRWLRRQEPDTFRRIRSVLLPHDWMTSRATGHHTTDRGDASGTGYWSPAEGRYRYDLLDLVDPQVPWSDLLPEVLGPRDVAGAWRGPGTLVGPGTGDNMAAALGLGLRPEDLVLSVGTSGTAYTVQDAPALDVSGAVAGFADATGRFLPLVCTMNATRVTDTVARLLGVDFAGLDELALAAPAGAKGLVLVPHLEGERTPNRPLASGTLAGIRTDVSPELLARAAVEGVVCNLLAGAGRLGPQCRHGRLFLIGGAARSRAYQRVVADVTGRPVQVPHETELVAGGAAVQAAGIVLDASFDVIAEEWGLGRGFVVEPDEGVDGKAIQGAYDEAVTRA